MRPATALLLPALAVVLLWPGSPAYADGIRDDQWYLATLSVAEAQQRAKGDGVLVAVVDSGIDATHPDLAGSVLAPVAVDGNTDTARFDPDGHGTALAGLIAGQGHGANREHGVLGIAPAAKVLPVVIRGGASPDASGKAVTADQLAAGIDLATQRGAKVICVGYSVSGNERLRQAVAAARKADAIVVAADGNRSGEPLQAFPAGYEGVLAAVPLGRDGTVLVSSTSGRKLGFGVPGEDIMTTNTGDGYRVDAGSGAPGILAGAVALVRSAYPSLPADEIIHRLAATATDAGTRGLDAEYGQGRLDLVGAMTREVKPLRTVPPPPSASAANANPSASAAPGAPAADLPRPRGAAGWLLALPLVAVLGVLVAIAVRAERTTA